MVSTTFLMARGFFSKRWSCESNANDSVSRALQIVCHAYTKDFWSAILQLDKNFLCNTCSDPNVANHFVKAK